MSAPSTSGLSLELLLRVIDVKYGCFTLLYFYLEGTANVQIIARVNCQRTLRQVKRQLKNEVIKTLHRFTDNLSKVSQRPSLRVIENSYILIADLKKHGGRI